MEEDIDQIEIANEIEEEVPEDIKRECEIFGSFFLSGSEFAISVSQLQEVVNPPSSYTSMPLAPDYLLGLFNLRGAIIPVVDLRELLKLKKSEAATEKKIAILELKGHCIGILFDKTGEIFRNNVDERNDFNESKSDSVIQGVFKKDGGQRLIQILSANKLFNLDHLPKQEADDESRRQLLLRQRRGLRKQSISFFVGPAKCALGINEIQEIVKIDKISESALAVNQCIGVVDLRGVTVPVIDLATHLGYRKVNLDEFAIQKDYRIIVMRINNELFGLLVDSVDSIVTYYEEDLKRFPVLGKNRAEMFLGCISLEEQDDIILLDHKKILSSSEIIEITRGHSKLYNAGKDERDEEKSSGQRRTFITFCVDGLYAIPIEDVKEIIERPKDLLVPPGLPSHCRGVLNLRGELVTIVDAREIYGKKGSSEAGSGKVLIFKNSDLHFGLVVDSIEAIASFSDKNKVRIPEMIYRDKAGGISQDVVEAVQYKDENNEDKNILILNTNAIATRVSAA